MKVILKEYVPSVGKMGDVLEVSDGFGRNYLLPRGLAVRATTNSVSQLEHQKRVISQRKGKEQDVARSLGQRLAAFSCTIQKAVGEGGRLYGSVTAMDIEDRLHEAGFGEVSRRQIQLDQPIKELGEFAIPVRIHPEVTVPIKVQVVPREG